MSAGTAIGQRTARVLLAIAALWMVLIGAFLALLLAPQMSGDERAIALMGAWLIGLWGIGFGGVSLAVARRLKPMPRWQLAFFLGCTVLALVEEAIATGLGNLAPALGGVSEAAKITGSLDYIEVVTRHSVVVFLPMFAAWTWLLGRYRFTPAEAAMLFGLSGLIGESLAFGMQNFFAAGMWIIIYGLMIYLPAHLAPPGRAAVDVRAWHYGLAVILPVLAAIPVGIVVVAFLQ